MRWVAARPMRVVALVDRAVGAKARAADDHQPADHGILVEALARDPALAAHELGARRGLVAGRLVAPHYAGGRWRLDLDANRTSGRGGKGIAAMVVNDRNGDLVAAFPILHADQIMLVTDAGQLIRCPVKDVRIAGRNTQGVRVFRTDGAEKVVLGRAHRGRRRGGRRRRGARRVEFRRLHCIWSRRDVEGKWVSDPGAPYSTSCITENAPAQFAEIETGRLVLWVVAGDFLFDLLRAWPGRDSRGTSRRS